MNIIFFGSSQFAVPSLKALLETGRNISCVVTQPDRKKGRGLHLEGTPVKSCAESAGLKVYQPQKINTNESVRFLKDFKADLFIVIAYGQILSQEVLSIPKIFAINAHASLLPEYRGAAPINWVLINGEVHTGVTIMKMVEKMDAGPIISKARADILETDTAQTLEEKLSYISAELLMETLGLIGQNNFEFIPQDENKATFAPRLKKEDGLIDWEDSAEKINNLIRGCLPWPGAFTYFKGKLMKVYRANTAQHVFSAHPGEIIGISKEGIAVATGKGSLSIEELQIEGKRRVKAEEFIAGHKISVGDRLGGKK